MRSSWFSRYGRRRGGFVVDGSQVRQLAKVPAYNEISLNTKQDISMVNSVRGTRRWLLALGAAGVVASLQGCFPVAATGIAVGAMSAVDRRTTGAQADDAAIELKASSRIREQFGDKVSVSVTSYNRHVLLTGSTQDAGAKAQLAAAVKPVENVRSVIDETEVGFKSTLTGASQDTLITTKVKAAMLEARDLQAHAVKVITENSVVYLMGIVTAREAQRAGDIASRVSGVSRVVRVFEVISEDELARVERRSVSK